MILYIPVTDLEGHPLPFEHNNVKEWGGAYNTLYLYPKNLQIKMSKFQIWYHKQPSNFTNLHVLRPSSLRNS